MTATAEQRATYTDAVRAYDNSIRRYRSVEAAYDAEEVSIDDYLAARRVHEAAGEVFNIAAAEWDRVNPPTYF